MNSQSEQTEFTVEDSVYPDLDKLENLSTEEFEAYLNDGSLPETSSKPDVDPEEPTPEVKEDDKETKDAETKEEPETSESSEQEESDDVPDESNEEEDEKATPETLTAEQEAFNLLFSKPIRANGKELKLESLEEVITLAQKGVNFEAKNRQLKPMIKMAKSIEANNLTEEDINLFISAKNGDKEAIKSILDSNNIEAFDLEDVDATNYKAKNKMISDKTLDLEGYIDSINNTEYAGDISDITNNILDDESRQLVVQHPESLLDILNEVKSGRFNQIKPIIDKENIFGLNSSKPFLVRYVEIAREVEAGTRSLETKKPTISTKIKDETKSVQSKEAAKPSPKDVKKPTPSKQVDTPDTSIKSQEALSDEEWLKRFAK